MLHLEARPFCSFVLCYSSHNLILHNFQTTVSVFSLPFLDDIIFSHLGGAAGGRREREGSREGLRTRFLEKSEKKNLIGAQTSVT